MLDRVESLTKAVLCTKAKVNLNAESIEELLGISSEEFENLLKFADLVSATSSSAAEELKQILTLIQEGFDPIILLFVAHKCGFNFGLKAKAISNT